MSQAVVAVSIGLSVLFGNALAQDGPFSNASLHGTYAWSITFIDSDTTFPIGTAQGLIFYRGDGTYRAVTMIFNLPGEPDAEGNPTRDNIRIASDPTTWGFFSGTYEVNPHGGFLWTWPNGDYDGLATRTEMIDGVLTITEYPLTSRNPQFRTGGLAQFQHSRIADGDILPPAPEPEE